MNVLVTGSNGYIGSNLVSKFRRNTPYNILEHNRSICDLTDLPSLDSFSKSVDVDVVIHTAAKANSVEYENAQEVLYSNIIGTQNIIQCFPKAYHIFLSSIVVYRSVGSFWKEAATTGPKSIYGVSKLACENLYRSAKTISDTESISIRLCAVVGGSNYTHGLINAIKNKIKENPFEIELFGTSKGGSIKPYIHIDDVYHRISYIVDSYLNDGYFNNGYELLTTSKPMSVLDVANKIFRKEGVNPKINWNNQKVWKGDNKVINYKGTPYWVEHYETSEKAIDNIDLEIY